MKAGVETCQTSDISQVTTELVTSQGEWAVNFVCRDSGNNSLVEWETLGNPDGTTSLQIAQRAFNGDPTDMARGQRGPSGQYAYGSFEPPTGYIINDTLAINNNVYPYFYWILELGGVTESLNLKTMIAIQTTQINDTNGLHRSCWQQFQLATR